MDVLLTHGYFLAEDAEERRIMRPHPPLGMLYLSSHLKARGFSVGVFDSTFQRVADFDACLTRERPPVVGIAVNLMTKRNALRMIAMARAAGARVVVGGPDPPYHAEQYLQAGADVVVIGEGEQTLEELLPILIDGRWAHLARVHGIAYVPGQANLSAEASAKAEAWSYNADHHNRDPRATVLCGPASAGPGSQLTPARVLIPDLNAQPLPDRGAIDIPAYLAAWRGRHGFAPVSLITARGCPYTCTWCSRSVFGTTHRRRTPANVADEVQLIAETYRPDRLWYADDVFAIHKTWTLEFARELSRRRLHLPFECISRAERIDDDVADALVELGCWRVWIGSESGSQRMLDAMQRRVDVDRVVEATAVLRRRGIQVGMFIMLGYDGEQESDLQATIRHLKRTAPDIFLTTLSYPIKGTPYYDRVADRIVRPQSWADGSDRDLAIAGRPSRRYYDFARRWMVGEFDRDRHWANRQYVRSIRSASSALVGRTGMKLVEAFSGGGRP